MPTKSLTRKLSSLKERKASLEAEIKKIEQEQAQQLRKEKQERARVIGMAFLRMVEDNDADNWTEERLLELVSPFIISGKERRFLGLESSIKTPAASASAPARSKTRKQQVDISDNAAANDEMTEPVSAQATSSRQASTKRVPKAISDDELSNEFNL